MSKKNLTSSTSHDKFRTPYNFRPDDPLNFAASDSRSDVQPDLSIGIRQLFARHASGLGGDSLYIEGTYQGEDPSLDDWSEADDPGFNGFDAIALTRNLRDLDQRIQNDKDAAKKLREEAAEEQRRRSAANSPTIPSVPPETPPQAE